MHATKSHIWSNSQCPNVRCPDVMYLHIQSATVMHLAVICPAVNYIMEVTCLSPDHMFVQSAIFAQQFVELLKSDCCLVVIFGFEDKNTSDP